YHSYFFFFSSRPPPFSTLFPYTTLFRSLFHRCGRAPCDHGLRRGDEGDRDLRARVRRLDARLRGRRVKRSGDGEHHGDRGRAARSEEHTSELQSRFDLVCRLLLEKKKKK